MGRTTPKNMVDSQELERRLRAVRDCTPLKEDCVDKHKADAHRYYDELIALGGRPTGPIQHYPSCKTTMADGMHYYRDEYETFESIFEVDKRRASSHWGKEMNKWGDELLRWQRFKESQQVGNRSELQLELESTDAALIEGLSKLNDWQDFEVSHEWKVYHAQLACEKCQQRLAASQNAMVAITSADATHEIQKPYGGWTYDMGKFQKELEDLQKILMWVKSQWAEVIAEACSSIAATPKLHEELEAKFETQANAIYRCLQQTGARPSRAVQSPNINAELPQRIRHWNSEISTFTNELWDWKLFRSWRRRVKDAGNMDLEGRKVLSQDDSCAELFKDLVEYQQRKLDSATSWVNCWRHLARQYMEARRRRLRFRMPPPAYQGNDYNEYKDDDDYDNTEVKKAKKAGLYALHAEEKVSVAAKRLEECKQKLRDVLAESGPTSTAEYPAIQRLPTPPKPESPEGLPGRRSPSNGRESAGKGHRRMANTNTEQHALPPSSAGSDCLKKHDDDIEMSDNAEEPNRADSEDTVMSDVEDPPDYSPHSPPESQSRPTAATNHRKLPSPSKAHRRSKKERARKGKVRMANINTEQHALPPFPLGPNNMKEHDDENDMLDHTEDLNPVEIEKEPNQADSENTIMSDVEDLPSHLPQLSPKSQSRHTADKNHRKLPSSSSQSQTSRKTRSSTKLDQVSSGKILKKPSKNKPLKKTKDFTDQQTTALLDLALISSTSTDPISLGRNEPESYAKIAANTDYGALPSSSSPISTSRKTRSSTKLDQASSGKILKKPGKNKPLRKAKSFTEQQTVALSDAASTSYPSTNATSLGRNVPEASPKSTVDADRRGSPAPCSQNPTSSYPSTGPISLGRNVPESYPNSIADTDHYGLSAPSPQIPASNYPSTGTTSLGRDILESHPKPAADTDHHGLSPPSYQTPTSGYPSTGPTTGPTSLGRNIPDSYPKPIADTDHKKPPAPSSQSPMLRKTRVDKVPPGKVLKKPSKNKPSRKAAKVSTEASTAPTPPRRSERLKQKAVAASKRPV